MLVIEAVTVMLGVGLGLLWPYVNYKINIVKAEIEAKLLKEIEDQVQELSTEMSETLQDVGESIKDVGNFDPEDQFQMLKLNLFQHFSNLAVDFIGKKLGGTMGVHQIESPTEPLHDVEGDSTVIIDG